ncbi:TRAP transporter small permease [Alteribacillus bidgolensis]|uniref:TRAP-type C4-dicarboxylate transport system, small permease component n=1 Tax=Alteribacillus bidgolensis TaxID=930129 RepID=A0A1G8EAT2_9BACI|nr:TRAP transporter small permease [Alteribacillus bidgolensis]SDH67052.1 TRAP-type C4-dicarboxylate transport system, small permease component [Alteribacillus bidgolensis]
MLIFNLLTKLNKVFTLLFFTALIVVVLLQITSRFTPISFMWTEELSRFLFIFAIAFGAPVAMERREFVRVDIFVNLLPSKVKKYYDGAVYLLLGAFSIFLIYYAYEFALIGNMKTSATLAVQMSYIYGVMIISFAFIGIYSLLNVYKLMTGRETEEGGVEQ